MNAFAIAKHHTQYSPLDFNCYLTYHSFSKLAWEHFFYQLPVFMTLLKTVSSEGFWHQKFLFDTYFYAKSNILTRNLSGGLILRRESTRCFKFPNAERENARMKWSRYYSKKNSQCHHRTGTHFPSSHMNSLLQVEVSHHIVPFLINSFQYAMSPDLQLSVVVSW